MDKLQLLSLEKLKNIIQEKHMELENIQPLINKRMNKMNKLLVEQYNIHDKLVKLQELINKNMEQLKQSDDRQLVDFVNCFGF